MPSNRKSLKQQREVDRKSRLFLKEVKRRNKFQSFQSIHEKERQNDIRIDREIMGRIKETALLEFGHLITPGSGDLRIMIPKTFCFCTKYEESIQAIKEFASSLYDYFGQDLIIDFSNCTKVDTAALFMLQIIRLEMAAKLKVIENRLKYLRVVPSIKVIPPKSKDVVRLLLVAGYPITEEAISSMEDDSTMNPIDAMGYLKGMKSQKHYLENKKSVYSTDIVKYFNSCLIHHGYELTEIEKNNIDGIIGEVLNNSEDHSGANYWYITANFSKEMTQDESEEVGEMNLSIMNFGNSIYEAFLNTKDENINMFNQVENYADRIGQTREGQAYSKEQLFTLATMQEQISRLKFEEESRGTGTMKFINSFLQLGDYEDKHKGYVPNLSIFSGNVQLICDNTFKPFVKDGVNLLSLNPENDLGKPPRDSHLRKLTEKFCGTLISVKIYLNKNHYDKKYGNSDHEQN